MMIRWTEAATRDLEQAHEYLLERNPRAAAELFTDVFTAVSGLSRFPEKGAVARGLGLDVEVRRLVVRKQLVFYTVGDEAVFVLRVWDARRDPEELDLMLG